jgi:Mn-dependent DtxR family transcriptional regulator
MRFSGDNQVHEILRIFLKHHANMDFEIVTGDGRQVTAQKLTEEMLDRRIGEVRGEEHMIELPGPKEEYSEPKDEPKRCEEKAGGFETGAQLVISSWLFSWWNK